LVGSALGDVDTLATTVVVLELPLKFLRAGHDAFGPFGEDLWIGFGATVFGLRLDNGGVDDSVVTFIDRGAALAGGLSRVKTERAWRQRVKPLVRKEQLAMPTSCVVQVECHVWSREGVARLEVKGVTTLWSVYRGGWDEVVTELVLDVRCWM